MEKFLLDTHMWVWLQQGNTAQLKRRALDQAEAWRKEDRLYLSHISAWEIANLVALGRISLLSPLDTWLHQAFDDPKLHFLPLDPEILIESTRLPGTIHRDPADRMLVATARHHNLTLLTRDTLLLEYAKQEHIRAASL